MTELQLFDIPGAMRQGYTFGTQQRLQREGEQKRNQLAALASQAYGADPQTQQGLVQQAYAIDPEGGATLDKQAQGWEDKRTQTMLNMARMLTSVPQAQRAGIYRQMVPTLKTFGLSQLPEDYTPETAGIIDQTAQSLVDAWQQGSAGTVQSTYIDAQGNRVAILRDGTTRVLGANAPNNQIIDTGNGFYGVNKGNLQASPVMVGGGQQQAPQAPSGYVNTPSGPVNIDPSLPPEIRAQIAANPDQFTQGGVTQGAPVVQDGSTPQQPASQPAGQLPPPLEYQNGGQLRSAPKPQAAPPGYRYVGSNLEAIPGGPADPAIQAQGNDNGRNYVVTTGPDGTIYRVNKLTGKAEAVEGARGGGASMANLDYKKDSLGVQKGTGANQIERGLQRLEAAVNKLSNNAFFDGGPLDQYVLAPTKIGQEMEQAGGSIMPALTALTRVPGVGSQSDWEGRLNMLQLPSVKFSPEVNKRAIASLRQFITDLREAYRNVGIPFPMDANAAPAQPSQQPAAPGGWSIQKVD